MFFISMFFSIVLLLVTSHYGRTAKHPAVAILGASVVLAVGPAFCMMLLMPAVLIQGLLHAVGGLFLRKSPPRRFWPYSVIALAVAYGLVGTVALLELLELRSQFPMESMEARLPNRPSDNSRGLDRNSESDIALMESNLEDHSWYARDHYLKLLHDDTVQAFIAQPGFGVTRGLSGFTYLRYPFGEKNSTAILDPSELTEAMSTGTSGVDSMVAAPQREIALRSLHAGRLPQFFDFGKNFGYFRDRGHVAGFEAHGFTVPQDSPKPVPKRTQLVGLVVHPQPVVYMTADMPNMADVAKIPVRPLDAFETLGLKALREGASLFARENSNRVRMLGPIRAAKQCTECHGCERGQLLGAFSYTIADNGS